MKKNNQKTMPLFDALVRSTANNPISFHVPGHKNGNVFPKYALPYFKEILSIDKTELKGLDDLHAAAGVIQQAQVLAADHFGVDKTFFMVGGSTAGNLAMILSVCRPGDIMIVQRNSHKSILNALELSGARPVFLSPVFDEEEKRYTAPSLESILQALNLYPEAKGLVLTYPDYFGKTFPLQPAIEAAHRKKIPVLIDEAHGVHFSSSSQFPASAIELGADAVVHSAHKMAPAMTMASFLHIRSTLLSAKDIAHYLQIIQSSSPSYPLMASLDLARAYLASLTEEEVKRTVKSAADLREILAGVPSWKVLFPGRENDPLKIVIEAKSNTSMKHISDLFEEAGIHPELATDSHLLLVHGLEPFTEWQRIKSGLERMEKQLKNLPIHATIEDNKRIPFFSISELEISYEEMRGKSTVFVPWEKAVGKAAAVSIIPYPPGIPLLSKGERITKAAADRINKMALQGINFQNLSIRSGVEVFSSGQEKGE